MTGCWASVRCGANAAVLASDLIKHDGDDLRDLPLIDRKRRLAELIGKAKRAVTRDEPGAFSVRERAKLRHSRMRPPRLMQA